MKGHMQDGKFHPHTDYKKGTRKSRDQKVKTTGVQVERKARAPTDYCPVCKYDITRSTKEEVRQHIKDHIEMDVHSHHEAHHEGVCDCGGDFKSVRKAREPDEGWQGRALSIPQLKQMLDTQNPELSSTNADRAIKQYYIGSATHQHARSSHPDYPNYCHHCGLNLGVN